MDITTKLKNDLALFLELKHNSERAVAVRAQLIEKKLLLFKEMDRMEWKVFAKQWENLYIKEFNIIQIFRKGIDKGFDILSNINSDCNGFFGKYKKIVSPQTKEEIKIN